MNHLFRLKLSTSRHLTVATSLDGAGFVTGEQWLEPVLAAERAGIDFVTLEDSHRPAPGPSGRLDAIMVAAWLAPRTRSIGLVPAAATTLSEPFLLSTQIATLDFASAGRAGWLAEVPDLPGDGAYVGPRSLAGGAAAFAEAAEHVEIVRRLWDSWEDDAEIRDAASHRFIDRGRIHHIDFDGEHLSVMGPSITPRPPQGQPPVLVRVADWIEPELALAAAAADVVLAAPEVAPDTVRDAVAASGRDPRSVRVLLDLDASAASVRLVDAGAYDGVRLLAAEPNRLAGLAAAIRDGDDTPPTLTLRARLGFERPPSRYAAISGATA
jgi:alkanesulfonate monooxygenase SsuD/methylene tetrahydromethanopterin reductase-like flavin-dependent oxidoreductase (luciferase family)